MRIGRTGRPSQSIYISLLSGSHPLTILWSDAPEIVFLLAVMIGERDRYLYLASIASHMRRLITVAPSYSGCHAWKRQSSRRGWKLLALAARHIAAADAAAHVLNQFEQMDVLDLLDAVGQHHKPAIDLVEFAPLKLVPQLFATQSQRVAAGVLAQHQPRIRYAHRLRGHDFIGQWVLQHAVLVNSRFMRKCIASGDGFVRLH